MSSQKRPKRGQATENVALPKRAKKGPPLHATSKEDQAISKTKAKSSNASIEPELNKNHSDHFLMKSEPEEFSLDDLIAKPMSTGCWDGVRNAQARNFMRSMKVGQQCFFYHSSCKVPGIAGIVEVTRTAYPDDTAWNPTSKYFDERSTEANPKWFMVDVRFVRKLRRFISLEELKQYKDKELSGLVLLHRSRLSVQPVTSAEWDFILTLEDKAEAVDAK